MKARALKVGALAAALVSLAALAGCQAPAPPPVVEAPPPPPVPPMALSSGVTDAAAAYLSYVRDAETLSAAFADPASIQSALRRGAAYEPKSFARGAVAYAAVVAMQDPTFVQGVRAFAANPNQREAMVRQIMADPAYAAQLPGAQSAAGLIASTLNADGKAVHKAGAAIKQAAYDVQRQKWSKEYVKDRDARLALAKQLSATPLTGSAAESGRLQQAALTGTGLNVTTASAQPPYTQTVVRGLAVAALAALGAAGEENAGNIDLLLNETTGSYCLNLSKLNLYQCLAVSKPHYEDVFCLGQHVLMDTGQCLTKVAGNLQAPMTAFEPTMTAQTPAAPDAATPVVQSPKDGGPTN